MKKSSILMASAVAGLLAVGAVGQAQAEEAQKVPCYGANKCKGTSACGGANHACHGQNACKGQGFVLADSKDACLKMEGGRLTKEKQ
jgi:uncharacterized membrane protein